MKKIYFVFLILFTVLTITTLSEEKTAMQKMNEIAESYIKLSFNLGKFDSDYVDAYFGPQTLKQQGESENKTLAQIIQSADSLANTLSGIQATDLNDQMRKRQKNLLSLLISLKGRAEFLSGIKRTFDEESQILYNAVAPTFPVEYYEDALKELSAEIPGQEPLAERFKKLSDSFIIPSTKLETVFNKAIDECRSRTKAHVSLPKQERFDLEYVKDKPWGAYNWFKGDAKSLIQVNIESPMMIDDPIHLASHEGYPGHHVYYSIFEQKFYKELGWVEFSIYPLFSPASLIAEGTANFAVDIAFPNDERLTFEKKVLCPLAGIDPKNLELYDKIQRIKAKLSLAGTDACRLYLDGKISRDETIARLVKYQLRSPQQAQRYLSFVDRYRSYIINYNVGKKMVKDYIERKAGNNPTPQRKWEEFIQLISNPILPEDLMIDVKK